MKPPLESVKMGSGLMVVPSQDKSLVGRLLVVPPASAHSRTFTPEGSAVAEGKPVPVRVTLSPLV